MKMVEIPEVMTDPQRPGILTTEFWLTAVGVVLTFLVDTKFISQAQAINLGTELLTLIPLVVKLCVMGGLVYHYMQARLDVKLSPPAVPPQMYLSLPPGVAEKLLPESLKPPNPEK